MSKAVKTEKLKDSNGFSFKKLWALIMFQFREKVDLGWVKTKKTLIQKIVFAVLKFMLIVLGTFAAGAILNATGIIYSSELVNLFKVFLLAYLVINLINVTMGLMKSLYYAEDNKLLVTFPVSSNVLFISKLMVFYLAELRRSLDILVPVTLGIILCGVSTHLINAGFIFYSLLSLIFVVGIIVVLGALLTIPFSYIYRASKNWPIIDLIAIVLISAGIIFLVVMLIGLIPKNIDLQNEWANFKSNINDGINAISRSIPPIDFISITIVGKYSGSNGFVFAFESFIYLLILIAILVASAVGIFFLIKPFYFYMMTKTFEFDKVPVDNQRANPVHRKYVTFIDKEFKITFRDFEVSGSYLIIYILVPILLFLIDTLFSAINKRLEGHMMTYAFNILLMTIPYLASNSQIATLYSKEGRAGYIKKTKPISPFVPLISKLVFNLALSIPSIIACSIVFYNYAASPDIGVMTTILLSFTVLFVQYAHIFFSATLDIMNPQNERYATQGGDFNNPNERVSTIVAFLTAFLLSIVTYLLLNDAYYRTHAYTEAFVKIFLIGLFACASSFMLFYLKIKAYYFEK